MLNRSAYIQAVLGEDTVVPVILTAGGGK
jgi:multicomponent Na+:H+ antiporter subunit D